MKESDLQMRRTAALDTTGQDWANHLSHEVSGNGMLYLIALLSGKPDATLLRMATSDLIDLQPVLGCRFDETQEPPVWVPIRDEGGFCEMHADTLRQGLDTLVQHEPSNGRQMDVTLLNTPDLSALCMRFDHAATDGCGAKKCLALFSRCYQLRCNGQQAAEHCPSDRSDGQIYARCGLPDYRMALKREAPAAEPIMTFPYTGMDGKTVQYYWTTLALSTFRRREGTVNDHLLTAYALALAKICAKPGMAAIHMTVDLRRYLAEDEAIPLASNLSGMASIHTQVSPQSSYPNILEEIQRQTALLKSEHIGLSSAAMMTYLHAMPYQQAKNALLESGRKSRASGIAAPILSNIGQITPFPIGFGSSVVTNVLPLMPAFHAPAFMLGVSSYEDTLTLTAGVYTQERSASNVQGFLSDIRQMLER